MSVYDPLLKKEVLNISDKSCFLPDGKTCNDCANKNYCAVNFMAFNLKDEICGYFPSKFKKAIQEKQNDHH